MAETERPKRGVACTGVRAPSPSTHIQHHNAATSTSPPREVRRYYPAYENWILSEAGIHAPKVQVIGFREEDASLAADSSSGGSPQHHSDEFHHVREARYNFGGRKKNRPGARQHRGLYATSTIESGELIMRLPRVALIGEDVLRRRGSRYLEERERIRRGEGVAAATAVIAGEGGLGAADGDDEASRRRGMERTLMALIEGIRRYACSPDVQAKRAYKWTDDGVALFLIGCREILEFMPLPQGDTASSSSVLGSKAGESLDTSADEISFLPHVSVLPTAFPTNRLYYTAEDLDRMGGEIRTDGVTPRRTDVLQGVEADWQGLRELLREFYQSHDEEGMDAWRCLKCRQSETRNDDGGGNDSVTTAVECCGRCGCFILDPDTDLNLDTYKWALSNLYSRSCDFSCSPGGQSDDESKGEIRRVIVPLLDMCNHDFGSPVCHDMDAEGNITVYNGTSSEKGRGNTTPPIPVGGEVCLNYGDFPNQKLLLCYGFFFFFGSQ